MQYSDLNIYCKLYKKRLPIIRNTLNLLQFKNSNNLKKTLDYINKKKH